MTAELNHFDIIGPTPGLADFYGQLLGWHVEKRGPGYTQLRPENGPSGAVVEDDRARVSLGVTVDDLAATVDAVAALGGEVLMPPTDNGWLTKALVRDPAGNELSLIQR